MICSVKNRDAIIAAQVITVGLSRDEEVLGQIRNATNGDFTLGGERFHREVEVALGRRATRGQSGRPGNSSDKDEAQRELL